MSELKPRRVIRSQWTAFTAPKIRGWLLVSRLTNSFLGCIIRVESVCNARNAFGRIERCKISEYTIVEVGLTDPDAIKAALEEMGYVFEEHAEAQNLHGYGGDKRQQKAHIIVRRQHVGAAANDVGFLRKPDGSYELIISSFDRGGSKKQAQDFMHKIKQVYGKHLTLKKAKTLGLKIISQKKTADNKIKIKLRV